LKIIINFFLLLVIIADNNHQNRSASSTTTTTTASFSEDAIKQITKSGFTREQALEELKLTNGDATKALVSLMAKSLSMPKRKR
jgi:NACalpha-BTF3-like transcription factor